MAKLSISKSSCWKLACFWALFLGLASGQASVRSEYEVKAAFLFNFTRFVSWDSEPADAANMTLCVLGEDPFGELLLSLEGKVAQGREISLRYPSQEPEIIGCQVLFVSRSENHRLPQIVSSVAGQSILTVSDIPNFASKGGIIGYVMQGNLIRFEINLKSAESAGLSINSRLLELASRVIR